MRDIDLLSRKETIFSAGDLKRASDEGSGVNFRTFASRECGALGFSTGLAVFRPDALLSYHIHTCSEAITVLEGHARIIVEGRAYSLGPRDCMHVPAEIVHSVRNEDPDNQLVAHTAFASNNPPREFATREFPLVDRGYGNPAETDPETILRWGSSVAYELSQGALFNDLFARRFGARGICGGYGHFHSGSSLPCHTHDYDESITIVKGAAICLVQGRQYELSGCDTAFVPRGIPHRFLNPFEKEMDMVWVYAGDEPDRNIVDARYCSGALQWPTERPPQ